MATHQGSEITGQINHGQMNIGRQIISVHGCTEQPARIESSNISDPERSYIEEEKLIEGLHDKIQERKNSKKNDPKIRNNIWPITGVAGSGKTEIARAYVYKYKKEYDHCVWIDASTVTKASESFEEIMDEINLQGKTIKENAVALYKLIFVKQCLIVFDDMDYDLSKEDFFPKTLKTGWKEPVIIITSRDRRWKDENSGMIVPEPFSDHRCSELLKKRLKLDDNINMESVKSINKRCKGLPLAIQQVAVVIQFQTKIKKFSKDPSMSPCTIQHFLTNFHDRSKNYVTFVPPAKFVEVPYLSNVYKTFSMAFQKNVYQEYSPLVIKCLNIMCMLDRKNIPINLIHFLLKPESADRVSLALNLLHESNIITFCFKGYYCKIHPVIQQVIFTRYVTELEDRLLQTINYEVWNNQMSLAEAFNNKFKKYLDTSKNLSPVTNQSYQRGSKLVFTPSVKPEIVLHPSLHLKCLAGKLNLYQDLIHSHSLITHMIFISERGASDVQKLTLETFKDITEDNNDNNKSGNNVGDDDNNLLREIQQFLKEKVQFVTYDEYREFQNVKNWIDQVSKPDSQLLFVSEDKSSFVSVVVNEFTEYAMSEEDIELCGAFALFVRQVITIIDSGSK